MALKGIGPFATYLIVGTTCFFLGMLFQNFPYDYYILWADPPPSATIPDPRADYFDINEAHLKFLHASPPLISRILHMVIGVGLLGFIMKLYRPTEANKLFDGASLVLYMCGITVYSANIVKGMRAATAGIWAPPGTAAGSGASILDKNVEPGMEGEFIGREDSLRVVAASNTILAFILVGVLVLQAGQWYAQRKEAEEIAHFDKARDEKKKEKAAEKAGKKKQ